MHFNDKWTLLTNVGFVDYNGARMWCHAVLIDDEPSDSGLSPIKQIRGLTWGGMPVFTIWADPEKEIILTSDSGGAQILMSHDGNNYNLDAGVVITCGNILITVSPDNFRKGVVVSKLSGQVPFGETVDRELFKYAGGSNYPRVVWTPLPYRNRE